MKVNKKKNKLFGEGKRKPSSRKRELSLKV
jgi:hypothetical protein